MNVWPPILNLTQIHCILPGFVQTYTVGGNIHWRSTNLYYKLEQLQNEGTIEIDKLGNSGWKTGLLHFFTTVFRIRKVSDTDPDPQFLFIGSCYFLQWLSRCQQKIRIFLIFFPYNLLSEHLRQSSKIISYKEVTKLFCLLMEGIIRTNNYGFGSGRPKNFTDPNHCCTVVYF